MTPRPTFDSPYDQHRDRIGQTFALIGELDPATYDAAECGPMYRIRFADGTEIDAWPEEVDAALTIYGQEVTA